VGQANPAHGLPVHGAEAHRVRFKRLHASRGAHSDPQVRNPINLDRFSRLASPSARSMHVCDPLPRAIAAHTGRAGGPGRAGPVTARCVLPGTPGSGQWRQGPRSGRGFGPRVPCINARLRDHAYQRATDAAYSGHATKEYPWPALDSMIWFQGKLASSRSRAAR